MRKNKFLVISILVILFIVNFLTFHDIAEVHSMRDWLTLLATILVFFYFAKDFQKK